MSGIKENPASSEHLSRKEKVPNTNKRNTLTSSRSDAFTEPETWLEFPSRAFEEGAMQFCNYHGSNPKDFIKLYDYIRQKTGIGFKSDAEWIADRDSIKLNYSWAAVSFFDDGGGEEGRISWSIVFADLEGNYPIQNEKLSDFSKYWFTDQFCDSFYCQDPFGLKGIYTIHFEGKRNHFD